MCSTALQPAPPTPKTFRVKCFPSVSFLETVAPCFVMSGSMGWAARLSWDLFFHRAQELADFALEAAATGLFFDLKRAELHQANRGGELRLVESRLQPADGAGFADGHRQTENRLGQFFDLRNARGATTQENTRAQIIQEAGPADFLRDELKNFRQAQRHNAAKMLQIDRALRQAVALRERDRLAFRSLIYQRRAVFDFELLRAAQRNLQPVSQVVRDVVAADREQSGVFHYAVRTDDVFGRAPADIDDERAQLLLLVAQQRQG